MRSAERQPCHERIAPANARAAFIHGDWPLRTGETVFDWAAGQAASIRDALRIARFKARQVAAFGAERARWREASLDSFTPFEPLHAPLTDLPPGCTGVESPVPGSLWKFLAEPGARVMKGDALAIVESMKMEIAVTAPVTGRLRSFNAAPCRTVRTGETLAVMEND